MTTMRPDSVEVFLKGGEYYVSVDGSAREHVDRADGRALAKVLGVTVLDVDWEELAERCGAASWDDDDGGTYQAPPHEVGWVIECHQFGDHWIPCSPAYTDRERADDAYAVRRRTSTVPVRLVEVSRRVCPGKNYAAAPIDPSPSEKD